MGNAEGVEAPEQLFGRQRYRGHDGTRCGCGRGDASLANAGSVGMLGALEMRV
jgi:hypothetical protein